jgi:gliding motility-associated lipoprotein GldD
MRPYLTKLFYILFIIITLWSCGNNLIPRPYGYFRVDLPPQTYRTIDTLHLPYRFDMGTNVKLVSKNDSDKNYCIDLYYPRLNAGIYCTYQVIQNNLTELLDDSHKMAYKHSIRADGIGETAFEKPEKKVYGLLYDLKGNTASSLQFILTDSSHHFFRAALYFENVPNKDSIAPMSNYIRQDMIRLIESFEWTR